MSRLPNKDLMLKDENSFLAGDDGYTGFENVSADCLSIPMIKLAQSNTPQAQKKSPAYIEGLEPGFFYNGNIDKSYGDSLNVVVLGQAHIYIEWGDSMGQVKRILSETEFRALSTEEQNAKGEDEKLLLKENFSVFVYLPDYPEDGILILPMASTKIKYWKKWLTKMTSVIIDGKKIKLFGCIWNIKTTTNERNGNTWYNIGEKSSVLVENMGLTPSKHFVAIKEALQTVQTYINRAKDIDYSKTVGEESEED
jgi:hypothetical protein